MVELLQAQNSTREQAPGNYETSENALIIERHGQGTHSVTCKWNISGFGNGSSKQKVLYSKYFEVGGYDCRLLVYPAGAQGAIGQLPTLCVLKTWPVKFDFFVEYAFRTLCMPSER